MDSPEKQTPLENDGFRFGIVHLFYITALIASGFAVLGGFSLVVSAGVMVFWVVAFEYSKQGLLGRFIFLTLIAVFLIALLMPAVQVNREGPRRARCVNNIRQLILAIHNYHSANGFLGRAHEVDADGKPKHSWRVRILQYIDEEKLYDQYNFDEPWDGPNNRLLVDKMPEGFRCPECEHSDSLTPYKLVSDPEALFHGSRKASFEDVKDGVDSAIVLVEDSAKPVNWMSPEDVTIEQAVRAITENASVHVAEDNILWKTTYGAYVCNIDGSAYDINPMTDPEILRQSMRVNDGYAPEIGWPDNFPLEGPKVVLKPQGFIAVGIYLSLLGLPGWFLFGKK